jgi:tRNA-Thr(GGU) m(6)t(6)A37 methyltransferase TsaA
LDFSPIGIVHRDASDQDVRNRTGSQESVIEVYPMFQDGLDRLDGFSHIFVLGYFHKLRPEQIGPLKVRPKGLLKYGFKLEDLPLVGVFSLDSPTRPNPIGLSLVRLLRIEQGRNLVVTGLDYFDGTPIVDIKPYEKSYIAKEYTLPDWHKKLEEKAGHV